MNCLLQQTFCKIIFENLFVASCLSLLWAHTGHQLRMMAWAWAWGIGMPASCDTSDGSVSYNGLQHLTLNTTLHALVCRPLDTFNPSESRQRYCAKAEQVRDTTDEQGLTGSRYPTRPDVFFNYPTRPVPKFENDRVAGN